MTWTTFAANATIGFCSGLLAGALAAHRRHKIRSGRRASFPRLTRLRRSADLIRVNAPRGVGQGGQPGATHRLTRGGTPNQQQKEATL